MAMIDRRTFIKLLTLLSLHPLKVNSLWADEPGKGMRIFENGSFRAAIQVPPGASRQGREAAELLARYLHKSTGVGITVSEKPGRSPMRIQVGLTDSPTISKRLAGLDQDGFVIHCSDLKNLVIAGKTDWGTEFGVYEFLERYLGIRWLLPGPDGEYIPRHSTIHLPAVDIRQEPVFASRLLSGLRGGVQKLWARRNRMHGRINFHHNLDNLFPPQRYVESHPEFFPILAGKRFLPPPGNYKWQPCFSAKGIVDEAVRNICAYFAEHPEEDSFSLGANDSKNYCECPLCLKVVAGKKNGLGYADYSDLYFPWANAVVAGVLKTYPDKWFGCLAHACLARPPRGAVHPRLIPFVTSDRLIWVDAATEAEEKDLNQQWRAKSPSVGWYDYLYGTPYCVPRIYFHIMACYYRYAQEQGIQAMYGEAYPNWGEGPKLYLALKLQWDPMLDVDAVLQEWYEKAVGPAAAPYLKDYYDLWEKFWTQTVPKSNWFSKKRILLDFQSHGYMKSISNEVELSRKLLNTVMEKAETTEQRQRAQLIFRAFEYYEASVISYKGQNGSMRERRAALAREFDSHPVLVHPIPFNKFKSLNW